ncbi:SulP family inorganic anion transporter [Paraburkholderia phytofirmans]|uniref:Sulphate transporter n=1 Tax=Paraburkholderia phytofirmans (strain DSM 17436 / LMG 22146 / PsJN) TaxID=398527 RepID=B2TG77_PARPJ|nr:SulP family inorganic anion transporter [Paraburkholderia phytofirmans]ACD19951.1 sulphate transporter [Paraburkholderia phytofirmans PsJN]
MNRLPLSPRDPGSLSPGVWRWIPALATLRTYQRGWFVKDLFAGVVLTAVLVPTGLSFAQAAGLPGVGGLYASIAALLAYAIFGPSRILVLGPDSALTALIAAAIVPLAGGRPDSALALAGMLAILSGICCALIGLLRLSFVSDLLSKPIQYGYLNGIALTLFAGQFPRLLGFAVPGGTFLDEATSVFQGVVAGQTSPVACVIGVSCLGAIVLLKRYAAALPGTLIAVAAATVAVWLLELDLHAGIAVVGRLPEGLAAVRLPAVSLHDVRELSGAAIAIALVSFADMSVLSRAFALRGAYKVDRDQELVALGIANIAAGLLQGVPVCSSASRTPVAEAAGAKTQLTCVVSALCIAFLLIAAPALLKHVPNAALAAVIVSAALSLFDLANVTRLYRMRRSEFALSMVCFAGVLTVGVVQGIFIAIGLSLLSFVWRAWHPYDAVLGKIEGRPGYHDVARHPDAKQLAGLLLIRWDAPLFFANAEIFSQHVRRAIAQAAPRPEWLVVASEPITDIDVTAADMLSRLDHELEATGIAMYFAEMKGPVKDRLRAYGLSEIFDERHFFETVTDAVRTYTAQHCVEGPGE